MKPKEFCPNPPDFVYKVDCKKSHHCSLWRHRDSFSWHSWSVLSASTILYVPQGNHFSCLESMVSFELEVSSASVALVLPQNFFFFPSHGSMKK